jgi:hypothetical protein
MAVLPDFVLNLAEGMHCTCVSSCCDGQDSDSDTELRQFKQTRKLGRSQEIPTSDKAIQTESQSGTGENRSLLNPQGKAEEIQS